MKPLIPIVVTAGLALASASATCLAATGSHPLSANAPRTVAVSEAATPPVIRAALLQSTLIVLPAEEKVANVFAGDTVDWVFDGGHVASRFISIKPKVANSTTDVHIVSDHGNEYTLQLREVSGDEDPHFDSKVFITSTDKAAKDKLIELPVFVPASELDRVKQDATTAKTAELAAQKTEAAKEETGLHVLSAIGSAVPVRLLKRDLLFILEKLVGVMDENRVEMLARQHGIRQKRDDGGITKTLAACLRRADEGTLSRLLVESSILLAASRGNPSSILKDAASAYKVDTDAIAAKVKQEFTAKEKAKKTAQPTPKAAKKAA